MIGSLERVSPTEVIVEWSQPPGGATMTGYVVFYYDGSVTRNKRVPTTSTEVTVSSAIYSHSCHLSDGSLRGAILTSKSCLGDCHTL